MFDFVTKNFVPLSAALTVCAVCMSMIFIYAYLGEFDANLIWIIEYPDLIKFGLIGVALCSGFAIVILNLIDVFERNNFQMKPVMIIGGVLLLLYSILFVLNIIDDYKSTNPKWWYHINSFWGPLSLIVFVLLLLKLFQKYKKDGIIGVTFAGSAVTIVTFLIFWAHAYASTVKEGQTIRHDVSMKAENGFRRTFANAKIVLITSHHTVLEVSGSIVVVPSSDIAQIASRALP